MKRHTATIRLSKLRPYLLVAPLVIFSTLLLASIPAQAQLPAGTTDTTQQPQPQKQDPLLTQANDALDKHDYPTALKLLTTLTEKSPHDPHLLYNLAFTQDALIFLDQSAAEATYRRAIAADPNYFDPHLGLALLLARNGKRTEARAELVKATSFYYRQPSPSKPERTGP